MKHWLISNLNAIIISIISVLSPIKPLLYTIGFLIAADFIFGLYRAHKTGQEITSRKMSHTITKMLLYNITIVSLWLIERNILGGAIPITKIAAGLISIVEIKSIDETFKLIFGFSFWDKIKKQLGRGTSLTK